MHKEWAYIPVRLYQTKPEKGKEKGKGKNIDELKKRTTLQIKLVAKVYAKIQNCF